MAVELVLYGRLVEVREEEEEEEEKVSSAAASSPCSPRTLGGFQVNTPLLASRSGVALRVVSSSSPLACWVVEDAGFFLHFEETGEKCHPVPEVADQIVFLVVDVSSSYLSWEEVVILGGRLWRGGVERVWGKR